MELQTSFKRRCCQAFVNLVWYVAQSDALPYFSRILCLLLLLLEENFFFFSKYLSLFTPRLEQPRASDAGARRLTTDAYPPRL